MQDEVQLDLLCKIRGCQKDYEKVLELEPNNFEATNELRKINQALTSKEDSYPGETDTMVKSDEGEKNKLKSNRINNRLSRKRSGKCIFQRGEI